LDTDPPNLLYFFLQAPPLETSGLIYLIVTFIFLLIGSGLVSGSEVAFFSLGINDIKNIEESNTASDQRVLSLKERPRQLLATILIANNFINIAIVIVSDSILKALIGYDNLLVMGHWINDNISFGLFAPDVIASFFNFLLTIVGVTFVLVLFGEAMPKIYATLNKPKILNLMSGPLTAMMYLFSPLSKILVGWSSSMESALMGNNSQNSTTKEDIDAAIDLTVTNISESSTQEADILKGIVNFGEISAKQIMHPRMDIIAIEEKESFKDLMKIVKDSGYSRLPVYRDDLDEVIGILYVKDLLAVSDKEATFNWTSLIRNKVLFIPESKKIDELLREFQVKRIHMAIVVDEYGGTAGLATLEDIMEEVIGDIKDEFDGDEDVDYVKIAENNYIFDGKTLLKDVCRVIGENTTYFDDVKGEADSLGGMIVEILGQIPTLEKEVKHEHLTFKVVSVTKRRIEKISLMIMEHD